MAGHSHSANVKYRKDRVNAAKAKVFSKMARNISVAAKLGGPDPEANPRLRLAIDKARMVSMPKDNIERAIKKGSGDASVGDYEEILYEGYAPGGVAVMLEILSDNRNRTAPEIRRLFERHGGNLGNSGAVAWMFERKAVFKVSDGSGWNEDQLMELAVEAGADDLIRVGEGFEIRCEPSDFDGVRRALDEAAVPTDGAEVSYVAKTATPVGELEDARKVVKLLDALDEHDDVQSVYSNADFPDAVAEALAAES